MELRVLQYFLSVAREGSISGASQYLHITQPTLSRQIKELEEELGKQLFIRGSRRIELTEDGMLLRQRAEEILKLVDKTEMELISSDSSLTGEIFIGSGECRALKIITTAIKRMQKDHPAVKFDIHSGNAPDIADKIDNGLADFGILTEYPKISQYHHITLPIAHTWGVMMRKDDPLAEKESITLEDIKDKPLIVSKESQDNTHLCEWFKNNLDNLNIISTYTLLYNATLMVEDGLGYAVCLDQLINTTGDCELCFRPLNPILKAPYSFIWKKHQVLNKTLKRFLTIVQEVIDDYPQK